MYKKVEEEGLLLETILKLFNEQSHKKLKSYFMTILAQRQI